jgi:chromate transporter
MGDENKFSPVKLLRLWFSLGIQSFGGGMATLALIRTTFVDQLQVLSAEEFTEHFALCQMSPGINLLALMILLGRRTGGAFGIAIALTGFLLPSVAITMLVTACYAHIQQVEWVKAATRGIIPATVGVGLVVSGQMALPMLKAARRDGLWTLGFYCALIAASIAIERQFPRAVLGVLLGGGALGALQSICIRREDQK